jgi:hypothetical protein
VLVLGPVVGPVLFGTAPPAAKAHAWEMKNLILLVLLASTLSMTACTTESYHRAFHHPMRSHDDWARDHRR